MTLPHPRAAQPPLLLLVLLIAFPQLSETLYAPVLPHIATAFEVPAATAQLTMSVYFLAFARGLSPGAACPINVGDAQPCLRD